MSEMISVIIPVYNVECYLSRCLESVCASRYSDLEIICIDDGSTDSSPAILDEWAKKDRRIQVVHAENQGLSRARNTGLDLATGDYISFIDSDDYVSAYYFELLLKELLAHNAGIAICGYQRTYSSEDTSRKIPAYATTVMSKENMLSSHRTKSYVWNKLFRSDLLKAVRFRPELKIEDAPFIFDVVLNNRPFQVVYLDAAMYFYFVRPGSLATQLDANAHMELQEHYAQRAQAEDNPILKQVLLTDSVKRGLAAEFRCWMDRQDESFRNARKATLSVARKCRKHRLIYCTFALFPSVYRAFLTSKDPTIRNWKRKNP